MNFKFIKLNKRRAIVVFILLFLIITGMGWIYVVYGMPPWEGGDKESGTATVLSKTPEKPKIPEGQKKAFQRGVFFTCTPECIAEWQELLNSKASTLGIKPSVPSIEAGSGFYSEVEDIAYFSMFVTKEMFLNWEANKGPNTKLEIQFPINEMGILKADGAIVRYDFWNLTELINKPLIFRVHNPKVVTALELIELKKNFYGDKYVNSAEDKSILIQPGAEYIVLHFYKEGRQDIYYDREVIGNIRVFQDDWVGEDGTVIEYKSMRELTFKEFIKHPKVDIKNSRTQNTELNLDDIIFIDI